MIENDEFYKIFENQGKKHFDTSSQLQSESESLEEKDFCNTRQLPSAWEVAKPAWL